jgi:hypothetical protein
MKRAAVIFAMIVCGCVFAQEIHLKTRNIVPGRASPETITGRHRIVGFDHAPGVEDLNMLLASGVQIIGALPDDAVVVSAPWPDVLRAYGAQSVVSFEPLDKLSPELADADNLAAIVEFHPDASLEDQNAIGAVEGVAFLRPAVVAANHAIAIASRETVRALATHDEVAYIFPADPALLTDAGFTACAGMLTMSGPIPQYANIVHGWDLDPDGAAHLMYVFGSITNKLASPLVKSEIARRYRVVEACQCDLSAGSERGCSAHRCREVRERRPRRRVSV